MMKQSQGLRTTQTRGRTSPAAAPAHKLQSASPEQQPSKQCQPKNLRRGSLPATGPNHTQAALFKLPHVCKHRCLVVIVAPTTGLRLDHRRPLAGD